MHQDPIERLDGTIQPWPSFRELPPEPPVVLSVIFKAMRLNHPFDYLKQNGPICCHGCRVVQRDNALPDPRVSSGFIGLGPGCIEITPAERPVFEVDYVTMVGLSRVVDHLIAANVWEDPLLIPRVLSNQPLHFGKWRGYTLGVGVIEGETRPVNVVADKAYCPVCAK